MIEGLKPYAEYKNTGQDWLGELPAHWRLRRAKYLFREVDERSQTGKEELMSVSHITGVTPRSQKTVTMFLAESNVGYKVCRPNDVVINTLWAWMAALGVAKQTGIVSPAYGVYRPLASDCFLPRYSDLLLRTPAYAAEYQRRSTGVNSSRLRLYPEYFLRIPLIYPPTGEQATIVRFLDHANREIDRFIRTKRRLIELLNEQKQAIIQRAATCGLDPNVYLKPSGIDWLGDVPEHWIIKPLKRWAGINLKTLPENTSSDYEFRYLDISSVSTGCLTQQPKNMKFGIAPSRARRVLKKGDTIISTVRTYLKAMYYIAEDVTNLLASTGFAVLTPLREVNPEYLSFVIQSNSFIDRVTANSIGVAYPAITETTLGTFQIALPPSLEEQQAILHWIKLETASFDQAIRRTQREIDLLREFRNRLITDIVTGKLDVRGVELPAMDEAAAIEDIETGEDTETEAEELIESEEVTDADE